MNTPSPRYPWRCSFCAHENMVVEEFCTMCGGARSGLVTYDIRSRYPAGVLNAQYGKGKNMDQKHQAGFVVGSTVGMEGLVVVVGESQVEQYSMRGYRLVEIVYSDYLESAIETTTDNDNGYNNQYGNRTHTVQKPLVLRCAKFVMVQSADDAMAQKVAEVDRLQQRVLTAESEKRDAERKTEDATKKAAGLESDKRRLDDIIKGNNETISDQRKSNRKLEGDIGKIRAAVGEIKMKEIIGG